MELAQQLLEHLRLKGCAVQLGRMVQDLRRPEPEVLAALGALRRQGLARTLRPGEWEVAPAQATEYIPPAEPPSAPPSAPPVAAVADVMANRPERIESPPAPPATTGERVMARKQCTRCKERKGPRAFEKGQDVCRGCKAGQPQGGVGTKRTARGNGGAGGRFGAAIAALESEREQLAGELGKVDQALEQLRALA